VYIIFRPMLSPAEYFVSVSYKELLSISVSLFHPAKGITERLLQ